MKKILGIGNALVDVIVKIPDESVLKKFELLKGGMEMIDQKKKRLIHNFIGNYKQIIASGGSTANTIHGLAHLGAETGYVGKISDDKFGNFFLNDLANNNITSHLLLSDNDTGIATTFITQDAERTFATYLGAAAELSANEIDTNIIKQYQYILVEGYLVFNRELILSICENSKKNGLKVAMDMASYNLVESNRDFFRFLLENYVDIIFANEEEAIAFSEKDGIEALNCLSELCECAVLKLGASGSLVKVNDTIYTISPSKVNCVDTNGAGDIYASGFLFGLVKEYPVEKTGKIASLLAGELVQTVGAKLDNHQWSKMLLELDKI